jgi:hypothetical protein
MFTIILKGASPNKLFNEVEIGDDFKKFERMLQSAYAKAPYFNEIMPLLHTIFTYDEKLLGKFLLHSYQVLLDYWEIGTKLVLSSELEKECTLTQEQKDSITLKMNELIKEDSILNIQSIERNIDNLVGAYLLYINRHSLNKETFQKLFERLPKKFASSKYFDDVRK